MYLVQLDRASRRVKIGSKLGRTPYLSVEEEEELVSFLLKCAVIGYAHTQKEVLAIEQRAVESKGGQHVVSDGWWKRFCERHPQLTLRTAMPLSYARALAMLSAGTMTFLRTHWLATTFWTILIAYITVMKLDYL